MNISSQTRRALLRSIAITAASAETSLRESIETLLTARVSSVTKGSSNKVLVASSRNGQSVSYTLPSGSNSISDTDLSEFYGLCLDIMDYIAAEYPEIETDAALVAKMLEQSEFNAVSYYTRNFS